MQKMRTAGTVGQNVNHCIYYDNLSSMAIPKKLKQNHITQLCHYCGPKCVKFIC